MDQKQQTQRQPDYRPAQTDRSPSEKDQMGNPVQGGQALPPARKPFQDADEIEKETTGEGR